MREVLDKQVDLVIDGGFCGLDATTVVDMIADPPTVIRVGKGDAAQFAAPA
jgi:tRNA A37 threonylcarbamoyladenosine synthetase subunit TsaC/SUA5/YrdC